MSASSAATQTVEVRAVGTVADGAALEELTQLLVALSGAQPAPFEQLEVVLRPPSAAVGAGSTVPAGWKPDLRLQHDLTPQAASASGAAAGEGDSWDVLQFSLNLRGKQYAALAAAVRHVTRTRCTGGDVPAFWRSLGFAPRFQLLRRGSRFWVPLGGQDVEVDVCHVLRLPSPAAAATSGGNGEAVDVAALQRAADVAPGRLLVEAVAIAAADADPLETAAAVGQLAALLNPHTALQRPPRAPGEPA